ncbi:MarR family winged helix-turn-helix transcriptional regulator [Tepidibacter thalassicus]|uniref:Transcriptional regulator, MarR family n=1 Tax=Tepidibacter thalassicus DSM 15285 TaxID=1123350 RepID=A0A1M5NQM7_9FIRM|nr:MarR family transcriptional regulator [Tepidibacter thalassicus]SHG91745.1 transcriptional regulator, MarR family [Tepidibacter thalassicus DSM 15285]
MNEVIKELNKLIVDIFYDIICIEKEIFSKGEFKDLSINEVRTIQAIGLDEARKMSEVAMDLKITIGTLTTAINRLEKKGYVERLRIEKDRRVVKIKLTDKGKLVYKIHEDFHYEIIKNIVCTMNKDEQKVLIQSLQNVRDFFKTKYY